jgi:hypothetical protein
MKPFRPVREKIPATKPFCAGCRQKVANAKSWTFTRFISGQVTTIWLCTDCEPDNRALCAVCASAAPAAQIPLCSGCLFEYESISEDRAD